MLLYQPHTGSLFPDWNPFEPVGRILSSVGLTEDEVSLFEAPFIKFRQQESGVPLRLPENIRTSEDWFRLLFRAVVPTIKETTDEDGNIFEQYGEPSQGYLGQLNLDEVGKDFLCLIYHRQRILDLMREGGLSLVLSDLFKGREDEPRQNNNLNNSLIPVEALTDVLTLNGAEFPTDRTDGPMTILSDPPVRHLTLRDVPSFSSMLRDTTNLSRFIRNLSSCLQDGGRWEDLIQISFTDFNLSDRFSLLRDRRSLRWTGLFGRGIAMSREFCLWDICRSDRLPSIRQISDGLGIPYPELLRIVHFGQNNSERRFHRFPELELLIDGFSDRLIQMFLRDLESIDNNLKA